MIEGLPRRHAVLLGVGHTNAHVLRMWPMAAPPDTDLTCISNFSHVTYSGMLPAVLAQQLPKQAMEIDLVQLCASVSARLITDPVAGIDPLKREIQFEGRPNIPFDVLSIGVGSVPTFDGVQVEGDTLIKIKPMQTFLQRIAKAIESRLAEKSSGSLNILVVGSGVAGIEITLCLPGLLKTLTDRSYNLGIVTRSELVAPDLQPRTRELICRELERRDITVTKRTAVKRIRPGQVVIEDGSSLPADLVIWATGASPPPLIEKLGLDVDSRGFLQTDAMLQSTSMPGVFAVGDTGSIQDLSVPKAGVYAVRQGPVLWENLLRYLDHRPLREYQPQRSFMKLINLGDGRAVGQWKAFSFSGRWVMALKNRIDRGFMEMFRVEPTMSAHPDPSSLESELQQQCRGCGCKLGPDVLSAALGFDASSQLEDAAEIASLENGKMIASTDFFSSPFLDPFLAGRVAALHSASDVIASAGMPSSVLANVVLPPGDPEAQRRALRDLLDGARQEFAAMGASLVGGHTIVGPRMELGFTVIGRSIGNSLVRKGKLQPGDQLWLTKPLGIGILLAAHMRCQCPAADYDRMLATMLEPQHQWARLAAECNVQAGTDITGFGLAGHLLEMLEASQVAATIELSAIPLLPGAVDAVAAGIQSTLAPANRLVEGKMEVSDRCRQQPEFQLLFDPQTCGGLLWALPQQSGQRLGQLAAEIGLAPPTQIGMVESTEDRKHLLRVID